MKQTTKSPSGTLFMSVTVFASRNELAAVCGTPQYFFGNSKVRHCWDMETEDGDVFTIYDWKQPHNIDSDEPITWSIGSLNYLAADTARSEINQALKQIRNEIPA